MMLAIALLCSLALDTVFGEPRRWHPLVGLEVKRSFAP